VGIHKSNPGDGEPADFLGVHDNATMAQFGVNTPIAIESSRGL
jgi:hypothetical protein